MLLGELVTDIPLLAEEGWRDSLIEAGAPGAKREPDRAKSQVVVSSAKHFSRSDHPVCAFGASTPPLARRGMCVTYLNAFLQLDLPLTPLIS